MVSFSGLLLVKCVQYICRTCITIQQCITTCTRNSTHTPLFIQQAPATDLSTSSVFPPRHGREIVCRWGIQPRSREGTWMYVWMNEWTAVWDTGCEQEHEDRIKLIYRHKIFPLFALWDQGLQMRTSSEQTTSKLLFKTVHGLKKINRSLQTVN